ncbi:hypothetical protein KSP40_PGU015549 [Platanthera guangdongensis]|uniref:Uncharacterized protein n=1 Tax=Platanthera guangdongensis TaxID=2320717 RepID=A0ABR2LRS6_9ASPA
MSSSTPYATFSSTGNPSSRRIPSPLPLQSPDSLYYLEARFLSLLHSSQGRSRRKTPHTKIVRLDIIDLSSDSRTVELINEAKSPENVVGDEKEKEKKENTDNAVKHEEDDKLRCHDSSGSNTDSNSKSGSGNDSDKSHKSGSRLGGQKNKGKKESLELKKEESSIEQNKVADQNKLTEAKQEIEATSGYNNGNTATIKEKKKGILGKIMEKLPVYGKNVVEETIEKATKDN